MFCWNSVAAYQSVVTSFPGWLLVMCKKIAWNDVLAYLTGGIAKRLTRNKQSTPTPYRDIDTPCRGVDIRQA